MEKDEFTYENRGHTKTVKTAAKAGVSFGSALAMVISFTMWKSVAWAILHGILGWVYVIYYLIKY